MRRSICYSEPKTTLAGKLSTIKFVFSPSHQLPKGTRLKFDPLTRGRDFDWEIPETNLKSKKNLICLTTPKGDVLTAKAVKGKIPTSPQFEFILNQEIKPGEEIIIIYGNEQGEGAKAQHHVQRRRPFHLYIDPKGKGDYKEPEVFNIDVKGNILEKIRVIAPSLVNKNERFDVVVRFEDSYGNLTSNAPEGTLIELTYDGFRENLSWKLFVPETGFINLPNLYFNEPGVYKLKLTNTLTHQVFYSGPIRCVDSESKSSIYWGTFHGESERFDCMTEIEAALRFFRDDQAYHFFSTSALDSEDQTSGDSWKMISSQISEFNEEDRFITFLGSQWFNNSPEEGLRQLIFLKDNKPILRKKDAKSSSLKKIYKSHTTKELFSIPSFTMAKGFEFDFNEHNVEYEPVIEIYNAWGSSECLAKEGNPKPITANKKNGVEESSIGSIRNALNKGHRFGFIAGGLDDRGAFQHLFESDQVQYTPGMTAIVASSQSRDSLAQALRDRRCYATTGDRIILDFNIANLPFGSVISTKAKPGLLYNRYISGSVIGRTKIKLVEIFRNGALLKTFTPHEEKFEFEFDDFEPLENVTIKSSINDKIFTYYYLRTTLDNEHIGWTSPIWIDIEEALLKEKKLKKK